MAERKEYIEKNAALSEIESSFYWKNDVLEAIRNLPCGDVIEVVRCKDCAKRKTPECSMYYECNCGEQHTWETDEDFCSGGVRKNT